MFLALDHIVINVRDMDAMLDFYTRVLGLPGERVEQFRAGDVLFPSLRINEQSIIDLFPAKLWERDHDFAPDARPSRLNHVCLAVAEDMWETLLSRLHGHGVEIEVGPVQRWGAYGAGESVYIRDPERNFIELKRYPSKA